jgi:hypothetical protein
MRAPIAMVSTVLALLFGACGANEPAKPKAPTAVTAADLDKDGTFWVRLTPDLKDELVNEGKVRLGKLRPDGASGIQAMDDDELIAEIDKTYSNTGNRSEQIYYAYMGANDAMAKAQFDVAMGEIEACGVEGCDP